jgi:hypothetical protein
MVATAVIRDAAFAGAICGMIASRYQIGITAGVYASLVAEAAAAADEFIAQSNLQVPPLDDTDKASIGPVVKGVATGIYMGRPAKTEVQPPVAADYSPAGLRIYAIAEEAVVTGGLT